LRLGPFELDSSRRILNRDAEVVWLPNRRMDVLLILASLPETSFHNHMFVVTTSTLFLQLHANL